MKLPKGVKRLRVAASEEALAKAIGMALEKDFNGYVRVTAPKGVKEAAILLFRTASPRLGVFQSPERSLYGPDAIGELKRVALIKGSVLRVEEFYEQTLEEVDKIIAKMRKARVTADDLDQKATEEGPGEGAETTEKDAADRAPPVQVAKRAVKATVKSKRRDGEEPAPPEEEEDKGGKPEAKEEEEAKDEVEGEEKEAEEQAPEEKEAEEQAPEGKGAEEQVPEEREAEEQVPEEGEAEEQVPEDEGAEEEGAEEAEPTETAPSGQDRRERLKDRITASQQASDKGSDEDILMMLKEVGLSQAGDEVEPADNDVDQYIQAFESFIQKQRRADSGPPPVTPGVTPTPTVSDQVMEAVDDLIAQMNEAVGEDEEMRHFIENQRSRILDRISSVPPDLGSATQRHERLTEQQLTLEHISKTFSDVLKATEREAERRGKRLEELQSESEDKGDWFEKEATRLAGEKELASELDNILDRVLTTHKERMDEAEEDLEDATREAVAEVKHETVDLDAVKEDFISEMRQRIQTVSEAAKEPGQTEKVTDAVHSLTEGLHERVAELERERAILDEERTRLEALADEIEAKRQAMQVDEEVEVTSRLDELTDREQRLKEKETELLELELRLKEERDGIVKDLEGAKEEETQVKGLESELRQRERQLEERESGIDKRAREVDELRDVLQDEVREKLEELDRKEDRIKAREMELVAREAELEASMDEVKREREDDVESDLRRVEELETELREREEEYKRQVSEMEALVGTLRGQLEDNQSRVEEMEGRLASLQDMEAHAKELEESLEELRAAPGSASAVDEEELRKLLSYLDDLLSKLPDKVIEKFSQSEYFELYDRVLERLGI